MTITADRTDTKLGPGDAPDLLREMAAVIRTVFGVGVPSSRQATTTPAASVDEPPAAPASIPVPASIPLPVVPAPTMASEVTEEAAPYVGEVPTLRVVPDPPTPIEDVSLEQRQALLQEVAFLDD